MDENKMIEIIKFEREENEILIGFCQNGRVVYASVSSNLDDSTAKQRAYEQAREALAYEQALDKPSIDGSEMESIEVFTPAEPVTTTVRINGLSTFTFDDDAADKSVNYTAVAYDQYGNVVSSKTIEQTFINMDGNEVVSATIDGVTATLHVTVHAYKAPVLSEFELLQQQVTAQQSIIDELLFEVIPSILITNEEMI